MFFISAWGGGGVVGKGEGGGGGGGQYGDEHEDGFHRFFIIFLFHLGLGAAGRRPIKKRLQALLSHKKA